MSVNYQTNVFVKLQLRFFKANISNFCQTGATVAACDSHRVTVNAKV